MYEKRKIESIKIDLKIDSFHNLSGFVYRKLNDIDIKHYIGGVIDDKDNSIYLKEYSSKKNECPIFIQGRISHLMDNFYVIAGIFNTFDSTQCGKGHVNLINRNFNINLKKQIVQNHSEPNPEKMDSFLKLKMKSEKEFISVTSADKINLKSNGEPMFIRIYDQLKVDGDIVKIEFNGKIIVENLSLNDKGYTYKLEPKKGKNTLKIYAVNEGKIPMNTSKVELYNNSTKEYFINMLYKGQNTTYTIDYE